VRHIGIVLGIAIAAIISLPVQTQELSTTELRREPVTKFDGTVTIKTKDGGTRRLQVTIQDWIVDGGLTIKRFPVKGFAVVHLAAGSATTKIKGESAKRQEEEFWTLPPGAVMSVETENDTAVLETVTVRRP
jgi:quercetin dioxygenase-like cupin family protein